ncbi:hypothetical protein C8Q79DRAFT_458856 [Trametes meyenii]|nr:hypothetical protein C8Q79DRAFT_458856 [Trametes meyenii]
MRDKKRVVCVFTEDPSEQRREESESCAAVPRAQQARRGKGSPATAKPPSPSPLNNHLSLLRLLRSSSFPFSPVFSASLLPAFLRLRLSLRPASLQSTFSLARSGNNTRHPTSQLQTRNATPRLNVVFPLLSPVPPPWPLHIQHTGPALPPPTSPTQASPPPQHTLTRTRPTAVPSATTRAPLPSTATPAAAPPTTTATRATKEEAAAEMEAGTEPTRKPTAGTAPAVAAPPSSTSAPSPAPRVPPRRRPRSSRRRACSTGRR